MTIPNIAFYCVDCGSFNLQVRHRRRGSGPAWPFQEWRHPNKGRERFDVDFRKDVLDGLCLDCNSTDWDAIEKGNCWWNEFREWFFGEGHGA
jgi:hypothetical protein